MPQGSSVNSILENSYIAEFQPGHPRVPFQIEANASPTKEEINLNEAANLFRTLSLKGHLEKHVFGQATIHNYVRYLEKIGVGTYDNVTQSQAASITNIDNFYARSLGEQEQRSTKRGALAEFATMLALDRGFRKSGKDLRLVHSKPEEDLYQGVDFFIESGDTQNKRMIACQVKSMPFLRLPPKLVYPVYDKQTVYESATEVLRGSIYNSGEKAEDRKRVHRDLIGSGMRLVEFEDETADVDNIEKAMIYVPSNYHGISYNDHTGIPTPQLNGQLNKDFEEQFLVKNE